MQAETEIITGSTKLDQKIRRIAEKEGFLKYNIKKNPIITDGGGNFGSHYDIFVEGKTVSGDKELNIFVKKIIDKNEDVKIINVSNAYKAELFAYTQLNKVFEDLQDEANVPPEERYKMVKVFEGTDEEMVIMENISKLGFKTYHRLDLVSLQFLELSVINLAKFHGLSFVIKEKMPEFFDSNLKTLNQPYIFGEVYEQVFTDLGKITVSHVDDDLKEKVEKLYKNAFNTLSKYLNDETLKKCLCHGDYRPDNIMMKEENGELQEIMPIDYQMIYYGCPVFDLLFLIYLCTDRDFRKAHMLNLKELYYKTLENFLKYFDLQADVVYPKREFEKVFKEKMDYALFIALQALPFFFAAKEDTPDVTQLINVQSNVDNRFKDRMRGVIQDFLELGFI